MQKPRWTSSPGRGRAKVICITCFVSVLGLVGCAPKGYRTYLPEEEILSKTKPELEEIDFYFSTLDSIKPFIHGFPTGGISTEAPNLDPREFVCPDSLAGIFLKHIQLEAPREDLFGLPRRNYEIIGEVEAEFFVAERSQERIREEKMEDLAIGPHKKHWVRISNVSWNSAFRRLRMNAREIAADAVLEIFCGKAVGSVFYPERVYAYSVPLFGLNGGILGYSPIISATPSEIKTTNWRLMGLAVRWKDENIVEGTGTVTYLDLEGGFYGIVADDGKHFDPINLSTEFEEPGLRVRFKAKICERRINIHMWGTLIELISIEKL